MATHPSVLAWRTPGTGEPGGWAAVSGVTQSDTTEATQQQHKYLSSFLLFYNHSDFAHLKLWPFTLAQDEHAVSMSVGR